MATLQDIKKRIRSVKNTGKITKAMKMVAAAKMRRATEACTHARPFAEGYNRLVANLMARVDSDAHPLLAGREERRVAEIIFVTSNRGLCGGFNTNVIKELRRILAEDGYDEVKVTAIGAKATGAARKADVLVSSLDHLIDAPDFGEIEGLVRGLRKRFESGETDRVFLLFNRFVSTLTQVPTLQQLLPVQPAEDREEEDIGDMIFEPSPEALLDFVLGQRLVVQARQAILESVAGEHAARMTAMDAATKNANEMIDRLTLQYNRARQAAITSELVEIISGAEAL
ncbi:MAG: ATP synthase F1 subunit gamma [Myxococcales bacterium]|nr:ATP synthase F1 subunit gamma [Myxococcales bacterium]